MRRFGHPSFADINEEMVKERASTLPENGIPHDVLKVLHEVDDGPDQLQPQKAATPCDGLGSLQEAGKVFAVQRPRGMVAEGQNNHDANQVELAALQQMQQKLTSEQSLHAGEGDLPLVVQTGNQFVDQFQAYYFAIAFPFCFKFATARPDVTNKCKRQQQQPPQQQPQLQPQQPHQQQQHQIPEALEDEDASRPSRRDAQAPKVDIHVWAAAMARRVETQFRRDWTFGFTVWNYWFRTMVNLQPNACMYAVPDSNGRGRMRMLTNEEIAEGGRELMGKLRNGKYRDITGELKPVGGDMTKLRHVPTLGDAARKVLYNVEARTRHIPGTHEVRKTMRHQTHANRVCYGTAIFITFSPSERDTSLMVRLTRARQCDPAVQQDGSAPFQRRTHPQMDVDYMRLSPKALAGAQQQQRHCMFMCAAMKK